MNKTLLLLFLSFALFSLVGVDKTIIKGNLNQAQLDFVKENFNWTSEDFLIVNFKQPRNKCHYDVYENLKVSTKWWTNFYSQMDLKNTHNIFVYSNSKKAKNTIDSKNHFADFESFFLTYFFSKDLTCEGIVVIHKDGAFRKKEGEYIQKDIEELLSQLR